MEMTCSSGWLSNLSIWETIFTHHEWLSTSFWGLMAFPFSALSWIYLFLGFFGREEKRSAEWKLREQKTEIKGEWEDWIYPSESQAALLLMELSNLLRNFIGVIGKKHSGGCGLFPSEIKKAGSSSASGFLKSLSRIWDRRFSQRSYWVQVSTSLRVLDYATAHVSNVITRELLWGRKHSSVLFVPCLAQEEASLDAKVTQVVIHTHPTFYLKGK